MREADGWSAGAAYVDGAFMPVRDARVPVTDWAYRRSDVTYDVVGVWGGAFFRLDDHLRRFQASMAALRMRPREDEASLRTILHELVRRTGLREAYVAMDCLRAAPPPGAPRHPAFARSYLVCFAIPWVWVIPPEMQERGAHLTIARTPRIPAASVDPRVKNFHWADMTCALFEAHDRGADQPVLLDGRGQRHGRAGFQPVRRDRRPRGHAGQGRARGDHAAVGVRALRGACRPLRSPAAARGRVARGRRDLPRHHRGRDHAREPDRRPYSRQRPARAALEQAARALLGEAPPGLARDAG